MPVNASLASVSPAVRTRAPGALSLRPWLAGLCLAGLCVGAVWAQAPARSPAPGKVQVQDAWLRPTVAGQSATGGYMRLTASHDLQLLGFSSPVAAQAQLHEMVMDGNVMQMRESGALPLPAGNTVALQPGAGQRHLMLMGLKRQLKAGEQVQVVLKLQAADGAAFSQTVVVPVEARGPAADAASSTDHKHHGHEHHHAH